MKLLEGFAQLLMLLFQPSSVSPAMTVHQDTTVRCLTLAATLTD